MLSPAPAIVEIAWEEVSWEFAPFLESARTINCAAWPLEAATAAAPPSRAAIRFSNTSCSAIPTHSGTRLAPSSLHERLTLVGLLMRVYTWPGSWSAKSSAPCWWWEDGKSANVQWVGKWSYSRAVEHVGCGSVNGLGSRASYRIDILSCVKLQSLELWFPGGESQWLL